MMYALVIVLVALVIHAFSKYQTIIGSGVNPLDEANLIESIKGSADRKNDQVMAGGDGQQGIPDHAVSVESGSGAKPKSSERSDSIFSDQLAEDGEAWIGDIKFTDGQE